MDVNEIVNSYENAISKRQQVTILSELTLRPIPEIKNILLKAGVYEEVSNKWTLKEEKQLLQMKAGGYNNKEIGQALNRTYASVSAKYQKLKKQKGATRK